jgi:hypothetical protein
MDRYKLLVPVEIPDDMFDGMWQRAARLGKFRRALPGMPWTMQEKRDCIKAHLATLVAGELDAVESTEKVGA